MVLILVISVLLGGANIESGRVDVFFGVVIGVAELQLLLILHNLTPRIAETVGAYQISFTLLVVQMFHHRPYAVLSSVRLLLAFETNKFLVVDYELDKSAFRVCVDLYGSSCPEHLHHRAVVLACRISFGRFVEYLHRFGGPRCHFVLFSSRVYEMLEIHELALPVVIENDFEVVAVEPDCTRGRLRQRMDNTVHGGDAGVTFHFTVLELDDRQVASYPVSQPNDLIGLYL